MAEREQWSVRTRLAADREEKSSGSFTASPAEVFTPSRAFWNDGAHSMRASQTGWEGDCGSGSPK
ncbi:MAG TPA: hypothetical protein VMV34_05105 [Terriglobia bacterium]|nr:hypothetical protein [Terriglobia bacterium]